MRLTCPNCGARYEVDDAMIPPEGRDVQCSNCSTTWFQPGRKEGVTSREIELEEPQAPVEETAEPEPEPEIEAEAEPEEPAAPGQTGEQARRELDPSVRDLLREEAEREARLRRGEPEAMESQQEMPLDAGARRPHDERAALREAAEENFETDDVDEAVAATVAGASRRDLLPDIEEINSTLRDTSDRAAGEAEATDVETVDEGPRRRRGARLGFGLVLLLAAALTVIYTNAPRLAEMMPGAAGLLEGYVEQVNAVRFWLDDLAQGVVSQVEPGDGAE